MEIFKKGVKEWEKGDCYKKGGLEDGEPSNVVFYFVRMFIHHHPNVLKP